MIALGTTITPDLRTYGSTRRPASERDCADQREVDRDAEYQPGMEEQDEESQRPDRPDDDRARADRGRSESEDRGSREAEAADRDRHEGRTQRTVSDAAPIHVIEDPGAAKLEWPGRRTRRNRRPGRDERDVDGGVRYQEAGQEDAR
jgi:hypothetical protein